MRKFILTLLLIPIGLTVFLLSSSSLRVMSSKEPVKLMNFKETDKPDLVDIVRKGKVQAVTSFGPPDESFLAVWYRKTRQEEVPFTDNSLTIFGKQKEKYEEVSVWKIRVPAKCGSIW